MSWKAISSVLQLILTFGQFIIEFVGFMDGDRDSPVWDSTPDCPTTDKVSQLPNLPTEPPPAPISSPPLLVHLIVSAGKSRDVLENSFERPSLAKQFVTRAIEQMLEDADE